MKAGDRLREIRNKLGITTREVEEFSRRIAVQEENDEFFISNGWITKIENSEGTPSVYKLYSLCAIYRIKFTELLCLYDVDLARLSKFQFASPLGQTHLADLTVYDEERSVSFPVRFDPAFNADQTGFLARLVETWAEVPIALIQHLNVRRQSYGFIGLGDHTLSPLIRPGSFVQIDNAHRKIQPPPWKSVFERPIYFIELRDGYACSWCEVQGKQLFLVPHPLSGCAIRQYAFPTDAEIVGRVTAVAMRLYSDEKPDPNEFATQAKRT